MKTKLTFLIIAAALAAATAGRAQTVISYSTDGGAQALETGSVRQTVLDTATLEVSYRMEWLRRPDSKEPMQDLLLLQAGGKVTKFFSYKTLQRDSLLRITPTEQVLANVGMCLFVMPVIGLTLPFISYGGSSLVMLFAAMGLVSGAHGRAKPDWLR